MSWVLAVVPAKNEVARIAATVRALRQFCDEVIVVDDGSKDGTSAVAQSAGARTIRLDRTAGKGAALRAGVRAASSPDVLLFADADLGESAESLKELLPPVLAGEADLTIAAPAGGAPSGLGLVELLSRRGIELLTGHRLARPLSGQRAVSGRLIGRLRLADGFGVETAMTIDALMSGWHIREMPINFSHNRTGRDLAGFFHRANQGRAVLGVLARRSLHKRSRRSIVRP